ncbi:MAG: HutD family protein [Tabrizicola sp.]|uniref:HutD/Ves family protein n=1 Tax=Tabrizicola sp. TaxID=2005166 RepID=UPI002732C233|nr:HutD family protein [Tabrizicola sp.]MDP3262231.1 HutD family protein [Tabrizicola sp.]MDP3648022.1 HutD family protein [Paracoccaceae bacterium]MDZ4068652.1 HutD family protein [Tabrizicola sp.]
MIHLTPADYRQQPWANGRGTTIELYRIETGDQLLLRLSMATVNEDGPFSLFPGIERNLTVLTGPGFTLTGDTLRLEARPLIPIAFPGDVPLTASDVIAPSTDFNVMTARALPRPVVRVLSQANLNAGGRRAIFALGPTFVNGTALARHDLVVTDQPAILTGHALVMDVATI